MFAQRAITPRAGKALLLRQDAVHHARKVEAGRKFLIRLDVMLPPLTDAGGGGSG